MKKLIIAAMAATAFIATPAMAQTTTISAAIAPNCAVTVPVDTTVNLSGSSTLWSNLNIICNSANGFNFSVESANGFELQDNVGPSNTAYPYTLSSPPFGPISQNTYYTNVPSYQPGPNQDFITGVSLPVSVNVGTPTGPAYAGNYSDIITWTFSAN